MIINLFIYINCSLKQLRLITTVFDLVSGLASIIKVHSSEKKLVHFVENFIFSPLWGVKTIHFIIY